MKRLALFACVLCAVCVASVLAPFALNAQEQPPATAESGFDESGLDAVSGTPLAPLVRASRPTPDTVIRTDDGGTTMEIYFRALPQGSSGIVRVFGENAAGSPVESVTAAFLDDALAFYPASVTGLDDSFYAIASAGMEQNARPGYDFTALIRYADGSEATLIQPLDVVVGPFIRQIVTLPPDTAFLLDAETERNELARLESIHGAYTPERFWDADGFQLPIRNELTSPFGAFRTFNDSVNTRHTGWDIRTTMGIPVMASEAGRVAFAGRLSIRGSHVIVDHGYGVFSGYSHLSQIHVTTGQTLTKGQIIGMTGATGRTSGPHFHWEMAVNGDYVDSVQFLEMWMP
ncbi:MAG: M23 family metallopeptidase [bacterium]|nr:M23 family metallopeptidase [bacterium]